MKSTTDKLTPEQEAQVNQFKNSLKDRNTTDMMELVKIPAFLRYVGRWIEEAGVDKAIVGDVTVYNAIQEGKRWMGERMIAEVKKVNLEAGFEIERMANRDNQIRENLMNKGAKFNRFEFEGKKV